MYQSRSRMVSISASIDFSSQRVLSIVGMFLCDMRITLSMEFLLLDLIVHWQSAVCWSAPVYMKPVLLPSGEKTRIVLAFNTERKILVQHGLIHQTTSTMMSSNNNNSSRNTPNSDSVDDLAIDPITCPCWSRSRISPPCQDESF